MRIRSGQKLSKPQPNIFCIVEFDHENSVSRALRIISQKKPFLGGRKVRIYKAGSRTQAVMKPQKVKRNN